MGPQDFSAADDWPGYFGAVLGKPPRDTLLAALAAFEREGDAAAGLDWVRQTHVRVRFAANTSARVE